MKFEVWVKEVDSHLSIKATGQYTLADLTRLFDMAINEAEKRGHPKVLLDVTEVAGYVPVFDMLLLRDHCLGVWKTGYRFAIVSRADGINKFFENVARNRGVCLPVVLNHDAALEKLEC